MIYLNAQQKEYLRLKLKNIATTDFLGAAILKEVQSDDDRLERELLCEHENAKYRGEKLCCSKCGNCSRVPCFESWTREEI